MIVYNGIKGVKYCLYNCASRTGIYTLSLHDALPISSSRSRLVAAITRTSMETGEVAPTGMTSRSWSARSSRSEEHTSELQSRPHLVCRLLLEKKKSS